MPHNHWDDFVSAWQGREDVCDDDFDMQSCIKSICKSIDISVPATVIPFAIPGEPIAKNVGEYQVNSYGKYGDNENDGVKFTITKKMDIHIPMLFGAEICFDKAYATDNGRCNDEDNMG